MPNHLETLHELQMESSHRHHPGYQTITANTWWCDDCLKQCHAIPMLDPAPASHWSDFFVWLSQLLIKGYAGALAAVFGLIVFLIDDKRWYDKHVPRDEDPTPYANTWAAEEKLLLFKRQRLLKSIDEVRAAPEHSSHYQSREWAEFEERSLNSLQQDLDRTTKELEAVERKLRFARHLILQRSHDYVPIGQEQQNYPH